MGCAATTGLWELRGSLCSLFPLPTFSYFQFSWIPTSHLHLSVFLLVISLLFPVSGPRLCVSFLFSVLQLPLRLSLLSFWDFFFFSTFCFLSWYICLPLSLQVSDLASSSSKSPSKSLPLLACLHPSLSLYPTPPLYF